MNTQTAATTAFRHNANTLKAEADALRTGVRLKALEPPLTKLIPTETAQGGSARLIARE